MSLAPEPFRTACLEVIYHATVQARYIAWENHHFLTRLSKAGQSQIAALMDAIHNLPHLLNDWEKCDESWLRKSLEEYDHKWAKRGGIRLSEIYSNALAQEIKSKE